MAITLRAVTGSALTHNQVDTNFSSYIYTASLSGQVLSLVYPSSSFSSIPSMSFTLPSASKWTDTDSGGIKRASKVDVSGSFTNGSLVSAIGGYSHAQGFNTLGRGLYSHAEGSGTAAFGTGSHAEGEGTTASGSYTHAEGSSTIARAPYSHTEGFLTATQGLTGFNHAEGNQTVAIGGYSHAEGLGTVSLGTHQHVQGSYNLSSSIDSAFIIGNGTSDGNRSNLVFAAGSTFQVSGSLNVTGSLTVNGTVIDGSGGGSTGVVAVSATSLYSTNPVTSGFALTQGIFLGSNAGNGASSANYSNFLGLQAGRYATNASESNFLGQLSGYGATGGTYSNFLGFKAGQGATGANNSNFLGQEAGSGSIGGYSSNFFGKEAGKGATNAYHSNFFGSGSGQGATGAINSNFIGQRAGETSTLAANSNFFGLSAGRGATQAQSSNFLGPLAGYSAANAVSSNFLGGTTGYEATNANNSNFIGSSAGYQATNASSSNFFGQEAGYAATDASNSTLIGYHVGSKNGLTGASIGSNNVVIGTNITLPDGAKDSINLGGVIFATGSYATTSGIPFSGSMPNARVGIATSTPQVTLDVSGSARITNGLVVTGSLLATGSLTLTGSAQITGSLEVKGSTLLLNDSPLRLAPANYSAGSSGNIVFISTPSGQSYTTINSRNNGGSASGNLILQDDGNGNVGINTDTPTAKLDVNGDVRIKNGLVVTGSLRGQVTTITPDVNNTASIDLSLGNFFSLTLNPAVIHISASNIQPGQTTNLRVIQHASSVSSPTFNSAFKQPSGSFYTASLPVNSVDILSFVSFDSTSLYTTAIKNLI